MHFSTFGVVVTQLYLFVVVAFGVWQETSMRPSTKSILATFLQNCPLKASINFFKIFFSGAFVLVLLVIDLGPCVKDIG